MLRSSKAGQLAEKLRTRCAKHFEKHGPRIFVSDVEESEVSDGGYDFELRRETPRGKTVWVAYVVVERNLQVFVHEEEGDVEVEHLECALSSKVG